MTRIVGFDGASDLERPKGASYVKQATWALQYYEIVLTARSLLCLVLGCPLLCAARLFFLPSSARLGAASGDK